MARKYLASFSTACYQENARISKTDQSMLELNSIEMETNRVVFLRILWFILQSLHALQRGVNQLVWRFLATDQIGKRLHCTLGLLLLSFNRNSSKESALELQTCNKCDLISWISSVALRPRLRSSIHFTAFSRPTWRPPWMPPMSAKHGLFLHE